MPRILVSDSLAEAGLDVVRAADGFELDFQPGLDEAQLAEAIKGADGLIIRSGSKVTARVIEAADALRVIGRAGIGIDNIDLKAASKRGIVVMNTPTGNAVTTGEHTISLMMSLARWIPQATASLRAGKWEKKKLQGRELAGKTLGVIGLGTIGRIVADRAKGLKMRVVAFDPMLSRDRATELGVELMTLEELWPVADAITVHTPLTPQTRGLINDDVVSKLKAGVLLINCARGGIYDEGAVLRGLESEHIGGAAFDVFVSEPPAADDPLVQHPRVVCSPHLGASTQEAQERVAVQIAEQACAYLEGGEIKNALNVTSMTSEAAEKLGPYIDLAEKLGSFLAQVEKVEDGAQPSCLEVECTGEAAALGTDAITAAAVAGFMRCFLDVPVNRVSAPHIAVDRGITVRELKSSSPVGAFASQVIVRLKGGKTSEAAGALGSDRSPRLVSWDDFDIEARLGGTALVVESNDTPGVIGFLGTLLANGGVNIASVYLGKSPPDAAVSLWNLDHDPPSSVLDDVRASSNVRRAVVVLL